MNTSLMDLVDTSKSETGVSTSIRLARFTSAAGPLAKTFCLDKAGKLDKGTAAFLCKGRVENVEFSCFDDFLEMLPLLSTNQALAYGVSLNGDGDIFSADQWAALGCPAEAWPRKRENFGWNRGPGIWMLDYDPPKNGEPLAPEALLKILYEVMPDIQKVAHAWWPSAGSSIYNKDTEAELVGVRGQRIFILVSNAQDIPRLGETLAKRLWLAAYGRYDVSSSGSLLRRTLVDTAVWQPERLDFAAGAKCNAPLEQRRGHPKRYGGETPLSTVQIKNPSIKELEQVANAEVTAKAMVKDEAAAKRATWAATTAATLQSKYGVGEDEAAAVAKVAIESRRLMADFRLITQDGITVSVGEMLVDPSKYHDSRFHEPLEPEYPDKRIAWANLLGGERPYLYSHAHGGCRYELSGTRETIQLVQGGSAAATNQTIESMRKDGSFFSRAAAVVTVAANGEIRTPGLYALKQRLEGFIRFEKYDGRAKTKDMKPADCPDEIARRILDSKLDAPFPALDGVVLSPTMTVNGRLLNKPGYDIESRLLLLNLSGKDWPVIPEAPTETQALDALSFLWGPVALFPYSDSISRGIVLAALLTSVVRRVLRTAPAFMFAAPAAGSGKTLLGETVVDLAGGGPLQTLPSGEPEIQKVLVSVLRSGRPVIFFDNVVGTVSSKELNAMLTSPTYDGRILGLSEMAGSLPTNTLVILTGNNARPVGDTCRRMLVATIDPKSEHPFLREFPFNPRDQMRMQHMELVAAALTILRGWISSGCKPLGKGQLASFEEWDRLVRQAVIWIGKLECQVLGADAVGFDDPIANIEVQCAADDENEALGDLLEVWEATQDKPGFKAADLYIALDGARGSYGASGVAADLGTLLRDAMPNARSGVGVSRWLRSNAGRVVRGRFLEGVEDRSANNKSWRVGRLVP